jgi:glycosyltransferase involved in cell wall biosynthesis
VNLARLPISVCIISGAEAHRISRALESVKGWVSEIVVVLNDNVTDKTEEVARGHGAKVFREPWKGYLAQKNSASEKCQQPWIFNLDADEVVSDELRNEVAARFQDAKALETWAGFNCPRLSQFCGRWIRHGDWYPDRLTRFWRKGQGCWTGRDPHPYVKVTGKVGKLECDLLHFSSESITGRLGKIVHFSDEFVRQHRNDGTPGCFQLVARPFWRFIRGYILRLGFLDGWQGFYIASHTAFATLVRYSKLREAIEKDRANANATPIAATGEKKDHARTQTPDGMREGLHS